jgi:hypothetical protein
MSHSGFPRIEPHAERKIAVMEADDKKLEATLA